MFDMVLNGFAMFLYHWPLALLNPLCNKAIQNQLTQYDKARGGTSLLSLPIGCPAAGVTPRLGAGEKNEKHEKFKEF